MKLMQRSYDSSYAGSVHVAGYLGANSRIDYDRTRCGWRLKRPRHRHGIEDEITCLHCLRLLYGDATFAARYMEFLQRSHTGQL